MRLRFNAVGHQGQVCRVFGHAWPHGEWVDPSTLTPPVSPANRARLAANPAFEADFEEDPRLAAAVGAFHAAEGFGELSDHTHVTSDTPPEAVPAAPRARAPRRAKT